jgi:SAM-dependent methyltransferase
MAIFEKYAEYYDLFYAEKDYAAEAQYILDLARRFGDEPGSVLDMGCGTGRHLAEFAKRGVRCAGFDRSEEMLKSARERIAGTGAIVSSGDVISFRDGAKYDLVVSLFAVMGYMIENTDLVASFRTAAAHLDPGGLFIFDGWFGPAVLSTSPVKRRHEYQCNGETVVREATPTFDPVQQVVTVRYDLSVVESGLSARHWVENHSMRPMFPRELSIVASLAGMEIIHSCPFLSPDGQLTLDTWNATFVARKLGKPASASLQMDAIEWIAEGDSTFAIIIRAGYKPVATEFTTPDSYKQQVGFIVYPRNGRIAPHLHRYFPRAISGTSEVLLVRSGRCIVDLYREDQTLLCSRTLEAGDVISLVGGGHGFCMLEDTVLLEIKQGPYLGAHEKVRFDERPQGGAE